MTDSFSDGIVWTHVDSVEIRAMPPNDVAAFAIDSPQPGNRSPGAGLEVNGWVIGTRTPLLSVRAVVDGVPNKIWPLDVHRPDVADDYPGVPHARESGFSFWVSLLSDSAPWQFTIEALLPDESAIPLADARGVTKRQQPTIKTGARLVTAPDFVIIGTQRGGTTSLHAYLSAHPLVRAAPTKELHYLTDRFARGRDWYLGQFPCSLIQGTITGEATPYALFHPLAPQRLREVAPHAKLIVLLRNPVDRAYSHYLLERSRGDETLSFDYALAAEPRLLAGESERFIADPTYISKPHKHASYLSRGEYASQLARWFAAFPRDQFLILRSEDLYDAAESTFARVTSFLNLPSVPDIPFTVHNRTSGPPLDPDLRARLAHHFAPWNAALTDVLGRDPCWN